MSEALARKLCRRLNEAGHSAYVVGGWTRDSLLGRPSGDLDLATSAHPEQVTAIFDRVHPTGLAHGTVTVLADEQPVEITTYRREGLYSDGRRPDSVTFVSSIEEDLARRDFTVNAIAWEPLEDRYIDPFDGMADLQTHTLRAVGKPEERFREDGLRLLRGMRFASSHHLMPAPGLEQAMQVSKDALKGIASERIEREFSLLFERAEQPSIGLSLALRCGFFEFVLPELLPLVGQAQNRHHAFDCWQHTLAAVDAVPCGHVAVRWAALLHDLGKPHSAEEHEQNAGEYRFFGHEKISLEQTRQIGERLRFSGHRRRRVEGLVATHMLHPNSDWTEAALRRLLRKIEPQNLDDYLLLKRADIRAKGTPDVPGILRDVDEVELRLRAELDKGSALSRKALAVDGRQLCAAFNRPAGAWLGPLLAYLLEQVIEDPSRNDEEGLLALAEKWLEGF
jgi:tRNA nucleotidyltransferase (CCA-adding enzyme)